MIQMFRILGKRGRITIPFEIRQRVGFSYNDVLSFTEAPDGRTVIVKLEKICDNCAAEKPQRKEAEDTITLFDFLNSPSDEQQKAAFAIHGLRVIDSQKGLFVQMPQNSFQKDGKTEYSDIFHPIAADARTELNSKVLEAYEQKLDEVESENEDLDVGEDLDEQDEDAPAFGQSM